MSSNTTANVNVDGSIATITITTPDGLNIMSGDAIKRLGDAVAKAAHDKSIRFTVIRAEGTVFIAGADIKEMSGFGPEEATRFGRDGSGVCDAIENLPSITIAALQGAALGGGCEIALACDFRIATANVKIGLPETILGLIPGWGGVPRAYRLLGAPMAKRLIFSGRPLSGDQAKDVGLVDDVVPDEATLEEAIRILQQSLIKGSPAAIALAKRAMRDGRDVEAFADCFRNEESKEGMTAFVEKRPAFWVPS
jgi:enoyl-CoA hydratase